MKRFFLAFAAMLMAFSVSAADPNIYASGLKAGEVVDGKVEISYLLNATATALEVQLIGADNAVAKSFALEGDNLAKGAHTVSVDLADVAQVLTLGLLKQVLKHVPLCQKTLSLLVNTISIAHKVLR